MLEGSVLGRLVSHVLIIQEINLRATPLKISGVRYSWHVFVGIYMFFWVALAECPKLKLLISFGSDASKSFCTILHHIIILDSL